MKDIWFISDTHFLHENILMFEDEDGNITRPWFENSDVMDEFMIESWNQYVKPQDRVYHLGDVFISSNKVRIQNVMGRLNGSKRLILGNHDEPALKVMFPYFKKVQLWRIFKDEGFVCTHIPLMPGQFRAGVTHNVHGHIHERVMRLPKFIGHMMISPNGGPPDPRYVNVCVEHTEYRPLHMDEIRAIIRESSG